MSYSDHKHLISCFMNNRQMKGSTQSFFMDFLESHIKGTKYGRKKYVDEVFYMGDPSKSRSQLADYDVEDPLNSEDSVLRAQADDQETLNLLNDYLSKLDMRREDNKMRVKTLLAIFMLRSFRSKFYKLELNPTYAKLAKEVYFSILKAQTACIQFCTERVSQIVSGEKDVPKYSLNANFIIDKFFKSDVDINNEILLSNEGEQSEDDSEVIEFEHKDNIEDQMKVLGLMVFTDRLDRIFTPDNFPYLDKKTLKKVYDTVKIYRSIWNKISPVVQINLILPLIGISNSAYNNYKSTVASELISLSNENSYEDITAYLLES